MTKDEFYDLALGVALVALVYAMWTHRKSNAAQLAGIKPNEGEPYDPVDPGKPLTLADLLAGTVHDISMGGYQGTTIPTTKEIFADMTGYEAPDSVVKKPGALW